MSDFVTKIKVRGEEYDIRDDGAARIDSPEFTGIPLAPTADADTDSPQIATTAFVQRAVKDKFGEPGGIATLDENGKVPTSQLPSYVDDVLEGTYDEANNQFLDTDGNIYTPESDKIYVDVNTNTTYRWSGTLYIKIGGGSDEVPDGVVYIDPDEETPDVGDIEDVTSAKYVSYNNADSNLEATNVQDAIDTVTSISKGKNRARVFATTEDMNNWLSDINNKGKAIVGDNLYIVALDVPDWWISEVLEEPNAEGKYYEIAQLETQKVDLTTIESSISNLQMDVNELKTPIYTATRNLTVSGSSSPYTYVYIGYGNGTGFGFNPTNYVDTSLPGTYLYIFDLVVTLSYGDSNANKVLIMCKYPILITDGTIENVSGQNIGIPWHANQGSLVDACFAYDIDRSSYDANTISVEFPCYMNGSNNSSCLKCMMDSAFVTIGTSATAKLDAYLNREPIVLS